MAAALKHLRFALRCWSLLTFTGQFRHFHARTIRAPHPPSFLITSPQFRPPIFQGKAFFRQVLAKLWPNFREKWPYIFTEIIDSQNAQGPDIMRRTEVNVFLVAMAILPFLQNMLLKIGTGNYILVCMYKVCINFGQRLTQRKPLSWTFCSTLI